MSRLGHIVVFLLYDKLKYVADSLCDFLYLVSIGSNSSLFDELT